MLKAKNCHIRVATMKYGKLTFFLNANNIANANGDDIECEVTPEEAIEFAKEIISNAAHAAMKNVQIDPIDFDIQLVD